MIVIITSAIIVLQLISIIIICNISCIDVTIAVLLMYV